MKNMKMKFIVAYTKKIYNLFEDYPQNMSDEEVEIFNKENSYWREFFEDRF